MILILVICIAIITAIFVSAFFKAKRRMNYADTRSAMRAISSGNSRPPSWTKDNDRVREFLYVVSKLSIHKGVPEQFATKAVATLTNASVALAHCAGSMEAEGASFNAQKLAAADMLFEMWSNASAEQRKQLLEEQDGTAHNDKPQETSSQGRSVLEEIDEISSQLLSRAKNSDRKRFVDSYVAFMDSTGVEGSERVTEKPTWAGSRDKLSSFTSYVVEESSRHGVAEAYAMMWFLRKETLSIMLDCISSAELQKFDFEQQKDIGVEFIKRAWINLGEEDQSKARNISLDADAIEMLSNLD